MRCLRLTVRDSPEPGPLTARLTRRQLFRRSGAIAGGLLLAALIGCTGGDEPATSPTATPSAGGDGTGGSSGGAGGSGGVAIGPPATAPAELRIDTIAFSGDPAPGLGAPFDGILGEPSIGGGIVAFWAQTASSEDGVWSSGGGPPQAVAVTGAAGPQGIFRTFNTGSAGSPAAIVNDQGVIVFHANTELEDRQFKRGLWRGGSGGLSSIHLNGDAPPGIVGGIDSGGQQRVPSFTGLGDMVMNAGGSVAYAGIVGGTTLGTGSGLWVDDRLVFQEGDPLEGAPSPWFARGVGDFEYVLNDAGQVAFLIPQVDNAESPDQQQLGLWRESGGGIELLAFGGRQAPGTSANFEEITSFDFNNDGVTAFTAALDDGSHGLWKASAGAPELLVLSDTPGPIPGRLFSGPTRVVVSPDGRVVFGEALWEPSTAEITSGVFRETEDGFEAIATGDALPDAPDRMFGRFRPVVNASGLVAFLAENTISQLGIWAQDPNGLVTRIAVEGQPLEVRQADGSVEEREILTILFAHGSGSQDGRRTGFGDDGDIAFGARFTDGTAGAFRATFRSVEIDLKLVDAEGEAVETIAPVSDPYPVVTLDPIARSDLQIAGGVATLTLSGHVTDALADILEGAAADILEVEVVVPLAPAAILAAGKPAAGRFDEDSFFARESVPVTAADGEPASALSPFPFRGEFTRQVTVPLSTGSIEISVSARNAAGNVGVASLAIEVAPAPAPEVETDAVAADRVTSVVQHASTGPGLVLPLRAVITDSTYDPGAAEPVTVDGVDLAVVDIDGELQADRPFIALARETALEAPNVVNLLARTTPSVFEYRAIRQELDWAFTAQGGRVNHYKYAAGTTVEHQLFSIAFADWEVTSASDLAVERLEGDRWVEDDGAHVEAVSEATPLPPDVEARRPGALQLIGTRSREATTDGEPGVRIRVSLDPLRGPARPGDLRRVRMRIHRSGDSRDVQLGHFQIVRLKTVIIGVDGLAFESLNEVLKERNGGDAFKRLFQDAEHRDRAALSALPSITFTNWPGIFSGQPPRDHGIVGNAYFARERAPEVAPFASGLSSGGIQNLGVVRGNLNVHSRNDRQSVADSLYDRVALSANAELRAWSVHAFYSNARTDRVDMHAEQFGLSLGYLGHDATTAETLDAATGVDGAARFRAHREELDFLTLYFPGPDNVAHSIGQETTADVASGHYQAGPPLPNVTDPLRPIARHAAIVTDWYLAHVLEAIEEQGYLFATLFAITADHGLHAFWNDKDRNLFPSQLQPLFDALDMPMWTGDAIEDQAVVYSPNGGMAHIYVRHRDPSNPDDPVFGDRPWNQAADREDIERVARALFIQAVVGQVRPSVAGRSEYDVCSLDQDGRMFDPDAPCFPGLITRLGLQAANSSFDTGFDARALGDPPAIFVRVFDEDDPDGAASTFNHFVADFRWLRGVHPVTGALDYATVDDFLAARGASPRYPFISADHRFEWPEFEERIDELNDKNPNGSRTGDILIFTDARAGYLTVPAGDEFNGWHGGATIAESRVPLMFNMIEPVVTNKRQLIQPALPSQSPRNWHLSSVLEHIYRAVSQG